jgi:hypothetical protein
MDGPANYIPDSATQYNAKVAPDGNLELGY